MKRGDGAGYATLSVMRILLFVLLVVVTASPASAQPANEESAALIAQITRAKSGAIVDIPAGRYDLRDLKIRRDLTLRGDPSGDVEFYSSRSTAKGILNPLPGVSLTVENIAFRGAVSPDLNGAGIRHDGRDLTVRNCRFIDNENGILSTGDERGVVTITTSAFIDNGHGDGYSHGIYMVRGARLAIADSRFVGTRIGHHVKSLARETTITGSTLDDAEGGSSYAVDASRGGAVAISGNTIIQSASSENAAIFNYDLTRGGKAVSLSITDNRIINRRRRGVFLRNATSLSPQAANNTVINENGGTLDMGDAEAPGGDDPAAAVRKAFAGRIGDAPATAPHPVRLETLAPARPPKRALLTAPTIEKTSDALFSFKLENNANEDAPADYLTFAHPLPRGA
ncbi:MAG: hypothetical protein AAGJ87_12530, partial [Pseudomonadota bacterium]